MKLGAQFCALLLLSVSAPIPAASLQGSCREAGYTACCEPTEEDPCVAPPTYCLCDPSCHEHDDCCDDIGEICGTPDHLKPAPPTILLSINVTYHTATLLWALPAETVGDITYTVVYWQLDSPNTTLTHSVSEELLVQTVVSGLEADHVYQWTVEASNGVMSSQTATLNFTTARYELEELIIQLYNSSSVLISWQPPQFPAGVQLDKYIVHYTRTTTATTDMLSGVDAEGNTTVPGSFGIVASLSPGAFYQFWVRADIVESGFHKADIVPTSKTTIYVPEASLVQLRGGPLQPCHTWTEETETQVLNKFHHVIQQALSNIVDSSRNGELIQNDFVICEESSSTGQSQAVYRATIYSTPNHTAQSISSLIEDQMLSGVYPGLHIDTECPRSLHLSSEPLCGGSTTTKPPTTDCPDASSSKPPLTNSTTKPPTTDCPDASSSKPPLTNSLSVPESNCSCTSDGETNKVVTVPILVTALVAELVLIVFVGLLFVAVAMVVRRRRLLKGEKLSQNSTSSTAAPNMYS